MQAHNSSVSPKKPSPLTFGSPRPSPFKRPDSPLVRSPSAHRTESAATSTSKPPTQSVVPQSQIPHARAGLAQQPAFDLQSALAASAIVSKKSDAAVKSAPSILSPLPQAFQAGSTANTTDALGRLHPLQVRDLRESFQVLDRDNDGCVTREDVADVLTQLGLDSSPSTLHPYFPSNSAAQLTLPTYLSSLSSILATFSPEPELAAAFAAFDLDDSGQIDIEELKDALVNTAPEGGMYARALTGADIDGVVEAFRGKRALAKGMFGGKEATRRGDVFRYREFQASISGAADRHARENKTAAAVKA